MSMGLEHVNCNALSSDLHAQLVAPITPAPIWDTLRKMKCNKAPRPNGFNVEFFLATWHIVGDTFCKTILDYFVGSPLHRGINSTIISLVPKVNTPSCMKDFRHISLCNVDYKCMSKILARHLYLVLLGLIDKAQSAFIKERQISDNVLMVQELFRGYGRETSSSRFTLKANL